MLSINDEVDRLPAIDWTPQINWNWKLRARLRPVTTERRTHIAIAASPIYLSLRRVPPHAESAAFTLTLISPFMLSFSTLYARRRTPTSVAWLDGAASLVPPTFRQGGSSSHNPPRFPPGAADFPLRPAARTCRTNSALPVCRLAHISSAPRTLWLRSSFVSPL
ncbi:hypothetical protein C8R44DRAFT_878861 [Mycena epipterygia]|nr:hypothetical protein C8R44DRAFT_878861 [Mycena epipterygia]